MDLIPVEVQPFNLDVDGCRLHNTDCAYASVGSRPVAPGSANMRDLLVIGTPRKVID